MGSLAWLFDDSIQPAWAVAMEARFDKRMDRVMALVQVEQADLDALDVALDAATQAIIDKIAALNLPPAQLQALQDDLVTLQGISAPAPAPEPPA